MLVESGNSKRSDDKTTRALMTIISADLVGHASPLACDRCLWVREPRTSSARGVSPLTKPPSTKPLLREAATDTADTI